MATLQDLKELFAERKPHQIAIEISGFTGFRTTVIDELTNDEINRLYALHTPMLKDVEAEYQAFKYELVSKAWKSKILAAAEKAGFKEPQSFHSFNNWMLTRSKFKKALNAHNIEELKELHRQIQAAISNNTRTARKPLTKAWWNHSEKLKNLN
ncbi:hypothetical protein EGI11_03165 [Chryseobacterium sp. H3056]|uniref:Uncharacterized protein n=1 Tax=Kaistella daneshvariae TaxID=2487074 RepID=A0A3N0WYM6_9FLAO|nr:hypothetical protein [Kaistella daneshvariae]ROI09771.1 hypothetical protein EGI11_03165 [Kaistella daneshvariae]